MRRRGQSGPAAEAQIVPAGFYPLAHGGPSRFTQSGRLEAGVAAGNQQQGGAVSRIFVCGGRQLGLAGSVKTLRLA